jgi:hypothetical protein
MWARAQAAPDVQIIGLDTEWAEGKQVVLLQLCDEAAVLLLRLPDCLPSPSLEALLADNTRTVKSGKSLSSATLLTTYQNVPKRTQNAHSIAASARNYAAW